MTGLEQAVQITPSSGLAPDEIERLIIEAETSIEKDRDEKELIVERNRLDTLIRNARRAMVEIGKSFDLEDQQSINGVLNEAEEKHRNLTSVDEIKISSATSKRRQPHHRRDADDGVDCRT